MVTAAHFLALAFGTLCVALGLLSIFCHLTAAHETRIVSGMFGALLVCAAFALSIAAAGWLLTTYVGERRSGCGTARFAIQVLSVWSGVLASATAIGGCHLTTWAGFSSRWWHFLRNTTGILALVTVFGVHV